MRGLVQDFRGDVKGGVGGRHAGVDGDLQQDLLEIARFELVRETGADVQAELLQAAERSRGGQHEQSARAVIQAGPRPDRAPRVARDQLLKCAREIGRAGDRAIDVVVAENRPPNREPPAARIPRRPARRNSRSAALNDRGRSRFEMCAAGRRTARAPAIVATRTAACPSHGIPTSRSPLMTSVGTVILGSSAGLIHVADGRAAAGVADGIGRRAAFAARSPPAAIADASTAGEKNRPITRSSTAAIPPSSTARRRASIGCGSVSRDVVLASTRCVSTLRGVRRQPLTDHARRATGRRTRSCCDAACVGERENVLRELGDRVVAGGALDAPWPRVS